MRHSSAPRTAVRRAAGVLAATLTASLALGLSGQLPTAQADPVKPGRPATTVKALTIPKIAQAARKTATDGAGAGRTVVADLPERSTDHFTMVGVTWQRGPATKPVVEVRTKAAKGG